jgi:hypothetical protein
MLSVTTKFQIEIVIVEGEQFFIMDTPGFNTGAESDALTEIVRGINLIRAKAQVVGVWHVSRIDSRNEAFDEKLRVFLGQFCGTEYIPQVTFVTTHWTPQEEEEECKAEFNKNLKDFQGDCQTDFSNYGAQFYQHGRRYRNGEDTGKFLKWRGDREEIVLHAKDMIYRRYGRKNTEKVPSFVRNLRNGILFQHTDAAISSGWFPGTTDAPTQEVGSQGACSQSGTVSGEDSSSQPQVSNGVLVSENDQNEAPQQGESLNQTQELEEGSPGFWSSIWNFFAGLQPDISLSGDGINISVSSAGQGRVGGTFPFPPYGSTSSRPVHSREPREWPSGLGKPPLKITYCSACISKTDIQADRNSAHDGIIARGLNPSLDSRIQMARSWDVNLPGEPGDQRWGAAFFRELNRRDPF